MIPTKILVTLKFEPKWVAILALKDIYPVSSVIYELERVYKNGMEMIEVDTISACLVIAKEDYDSFKGVLERIIFDIFDVEVLGEVVFITATEFQENENHIRTHLKSKVYGSAIERSKQLVSAHEFKSIIKEIHKVANNIIKHKAKDIFSMQCYLFSINDGCGLTSALEIFRDLFIEEELYDLHPHLDPYEKLLPYSDDPKESAIEVMMSCLRNIDKAIVCLDISEWMQKIHTHKFKLLLKFISQNNHDKVYVFRVPYIEKDVLEMIRKSLNDIVFVKSVSFIPFTNDEIIELARRKLSMYDYKLLESAEKAFMQKIIEEKNDGKFYGVNTVHKVVSEIIYHKSLGDYDCENEDLENDHNTTIDVINDDHINCDVISYDDINMILETKENDHMRGYEELDLLVGMAPIKKKIKEVISQIKIASKYRQKDKPCIHMRFCGAPGTGKTTVARIIGKILKENKILSIGHFYEISGRDLVGQYIGHTAPKTMEICRDAHGSVLFIDEAYSLYRNDEKSKDYGLEALDTLISELENHRHDMVIIFSGYSDEMDLLLKGNIGLASRIPYEVNFPNYTREELFDIFISMVQKSGASYTKEFFDEVNEYFNNLPDSVIGAKEFGNARFVRNLYDRTWGKAAIRCELGNIDISFTVEDFVSANSEKEFAELNRKKTLKLGFLS